MRKRLTVLLTAGTLAAPVLNATAATTYAATPKKVVTKKYAGQSFQADRWGTVQVTVTVRTTTVAGKKATRKYIDLGGSYSYHTDRSQYIMSQSLPYLRQEFLSAQSPNVQVVSGATYTSQAFEQSLQSALAKANHLSVAVSALPGVRRVEHVMGMPIVVDIRDDGGEEAVERLFDWFRWVDATFSTYKDESRSAA